MPQANLVGCFEVVSMIVGVVLILIGLGCANQNPEYETFCHGMTVVGVILTVGGAAAKAMIRK